MISEANTLVGYFLKIAALAGVNLNADDLHVEQLPAPHKSPTKLPTGKMAVYIFVYGDIVLKVGKVGPKSNARYTSQHYTGSAPSTLAKSLINRGNEVGINDLSAATVSIAKTPKKDTMSVQQLAEKSLIINRPCGNEELIRTISRIDRQRQNLLKN